MNALKLTPRTILMLVLAAFPAAALAQMAPDGNARPEQPVVNAPNTNALPLSEHEGEPTATPAQKRDFARAVNLDPLRDLAVGHNGRVMILDTLARESVRTITGRKDFIDIISGEQDPSETKTFKPDPLFTLFDFIFDPAYYTDKPLIYIEYLPLRRALLEIAFPGDEYAQAVWNKRTRVSPSIIDDNVEEVFREYSDEPAFRRAFAQLDDKHELFLFGASNLLLVAPESRDKAWLPLTSLEPNHPTRKAAAELADAWFERDVDRANSAIATLADVLPTIHPDIYPTSRRDLELIYNRSNAFTWGAWVYLVSLVMLVLAIGTGRKWLIIGGVGALILAIALHTFGFTARCLIAERFAIQNQYESMTGVSLFAAVVGLVIMVWRRQWFFGAAAAGAGFLILTGATQLAIPGKSITPMAAILNTSVLLKYHVTTVLTSYGLITLAMVVSLFYLFTHYARRGPTAIHASLGSAGPAGAPSKAAGSESRGPQDSSPAALDSSSLSPLGRGQGAGSLSSSAPSRARLLADLDRAQMVILQLAFWTLGVGTLLGAWWADHSWGRWWAFDPKETWALITWIIYLIVIHARFGMGGEKRALVTAWLSVLGFLVMLWTYFGVNLLLPGLHAYA